jgi:hypothetical protein
MNNHKRKIYSCAFSSEVCPDFCTILYVYICIYIYIYKETNLVYASVAKNERQKWREERQLSLRNAPRGTELLY